MTKLLGLLILITGIFFFAFTMDDVTPFWLNQPHKKLESLWRQDLQVLKNHNLLPNEWEMVSEVQIFPLGPEAKEFLTQIQRPFQEKEGGAYKLEVEVDSWVEEENQTIVIQYRLLEKESQNIIWELGRTLSTATSQ